MPLLIWIAVQVHAYHTERQALAAPEPVIATLIQRPRNLSLGPVPVYVKTADVLRLQRFAPKIPDIPVNDAEPSLAEVPAAAGVRSSGAPCNDRPGRRRQRLERILRRRRTR